MDAFLVGLTKFIQGERHLLTGKELELTQAGRDVTVATLPVVEGVDDVFFGEKGEGRSAFNRELLRLITKA